jgi:tRNASer (uridine44-2'-O)-methyltransferase
LTIRPSESALFPEYDWIIGNHSDELTPWIPVIAARSSYHCNFFLLPCCAYEFNGNKFLRRDCSVSQYEDYMNYLFNLCEVSGFRVKRDKLRIPSTKRTCFVSFGRVYNEEDSSAYDEKISTFIKSQDVDNSRSNHNNEWVNDFKPRENKESVRNCTQLNSKLIGSIINLVTTTLLENRNTENLAEWYSGKEIHICDLVNRIPKCDLQELKKEHGGLKTLLKNHHFIFKIENDMVKFRKPSPRSKDFKHRKLKPCWFYNNHPDSCPLENELCSFIHQDLNPC